MKTIWVLVADEAIARVLAWPEAGDELQPVEELTDAAAHADAADLRRDAQGRRAAGGGVSGHGGPSGSQGGAGATASAGQDPQHLEAERFAARVAKRLAEAQQQRRFDELHVAAAPRFLGLLRKAWTPQVKAAIARERDKDLVHLTAREIGDALFAGRDGAG